jgi:hypothetical protein
VDERRALGERRLRINDGGLRLVVDHHELCRVGGELSRRRDDDRDAVADIARLVGGERPVRRQIDVLRDRPGARQRSGPVARELLARVGGEHAGRLPGGREIHAADARMRVRAAHHRHPDHAGQLDVVDVFRPAREQLQVFLAFDGRADDTPDLELGDRGHRAS